MPDNQKFYESPFGTVTFIDKGMVPRLTSSRMETVFQETLKAKDITKTKGAWRKKGEYLSEKQEEIDFKIQMLSPFSFTDELEILTLAASVILKSTTDGTIYRSRLGEIMTAVKECGIADGARIDGKWKITRDAWKSGWYVQYLGTREGEY